MEITEWRRGLPPHVVEASFSKLVISNLPACRLVCRTWNALILDYASSSKFFTNDFILFTCDGDPNCGPNNLCNPKIHCFRLDPTKHFDVDFDLELEVNRSASLRFDGDWSIILPINSCNGLLFISRCTYNSSCEVIFNPMTNEFFQVPHGEADVDIYAFGFGFIPTTKQYKLFRVKKSDIIGFSTQERSPIMDVLMFGSKQNKWRHLYSLPFDIYRGGAYFNGVIYWLGKEKDKQNEYVIYSLDVQTEKIELSAVLEVGPFSNCVWAYIQQFNGSVYAIIHINRATTNESIQVWRMQEKDSWIRDFVIDDINLKDSGLITLMKAYENGEILCMVKPRFFWLYNPFTRRKKIITMKNKKKLFTGICQIESLNFGSLPNILAGDERRRMRSKRKSRRMRS